MDDMNCGVAVDLSQNRKNVEEKIIRRRNRMNGKRKKEICVNSLIKIRIRCLQ